LLDSLLQEIIMAESKMVESIDWSKIVHTVAIGAAIAGLGYLTVQYYRDKNEAKKENSWKMFCKKLRATREAVFNTSDTMRESFEESLESMQESISNTFQEWTEDLKNTLMSEETQDALDTILQLLDHVNRFDMKGKPYNGSFFLLLAIVKKVQNLTEFVSWEESLPTASNISEEELSRAKRFGMFALGTYSASRETEIEKIAEKMGVTSEEVLLTGFKTDHEGLCPKFLVVADSETKSIVLAIRGTLSLKDVVLDMVCEETTYLDGFTHKGILTGARNVWTQACASVVSALNVNPGYSLIVTGHSLGAGVAVLIALELLMGDSKAALPEETSVRCVALAPPPVYRSGQSIFSRSLPTAVSESIEIFIHNHDCIPRMSLGSLTRLLTSMRAVDNLALSVKEQVDILMDKEEELLEKTVEAINQAKQDQFPFLQHPGKIFYLKKGQGEEGRYVAIPETSESFTGRLYLLDDMVRDHRKPSYREAITGL